MIKKEEIEKLAELSRIAITDTQIESFRTDIESILGYISEIQKAKGEGCDMSKGLIKNVMREDTNPHGSGQYTEKLVKAMPKTEKGYLKVKKIL